MEKKKHITYVTNKWAPNYMSSLAIGDGIIKTGEYNLKHLLELEEAGEDVRISIPEKSLLNTLRQRSGAKLSVEEDRVTLRADENTTVLLIQPSSSIQDFKYDDYLPDFISLKLNEYTVK